MYLAITQGMAEWLLPKIGVIDDLCEVIKKLTQDSKNLAGKLFAEGPFRLSLSSDGSLLTLWHSDYLLGTGDESFGLIKISGEMSLTSHLAITKEALERSIYLTNQRIQGFLVEGAFLHRKHEENIHTLLAGRGTEARQYSLGYYDIIKGTEDNANRTLLSVGPSDSFRLLVSAVKEELIKIDSLSAEANAIINNSKTENSVHVSELSALRDSVRLYLEEPISQHDFQNTQIVTGEKSVSVDDAYKALGLNYDDWLKSDSPLSDAQRRVLASEALDKYPIRILGPGGSGKTLLMQLLALKKIYSAKQKNIPCRIMYIVHSEAMKSKVSQRFELLASGGSNEDDYIIEVTTLSEFCRKKLQLSVDAILDPDADDAKGFQLEQIKEALTDVKNNNHNIIDKSPLLFSVYGNSDLAEVFSKLILAEISISIKGHGLEQDKRRYIESERSLSRLHGILTKDEREFVYNIFEAYHHEVFEKYGALDPDDIALSLYGAIKTPVWRLRRKKEGFDYIFVDEAQLFNENERRLFSLLSNDSTKHVPIALALDEAQSFYGQSNAGFATLGIKDISNQNLDSIQRSTIEIAKLAFFIIQRSTNLFSADFPDFTCIQSFHEPSKKLKNLKPNIEKEGSDSPGFSKFILRRVRELRSENIRQIAIICHIESHWNSIESELSKAGLPFQVIRERGEKIKADQPTVVLCRPAQVGGQEFDAVIVIGLEKGALTIKDNSALESAIEQQMIREAYLSVTRARYRVIFAISNLSTENELLFDAVEAGLISR